MQSIFFLKEVGGGNKGSSLKKNDKFLLLFWVTKYVF